MTGMMPYHRMRRWRADHHYHNSLLILRLKWLEAFSPPSLADDGRVVIAKETTKGKSVRKNTWCWGGKDRTC